MEQTHKINTNLNIKLYSNSVTKTKIIINYHTPIFVHYKEEITYIQYKFLFFLNNLPLITYTICRKFELILSYTNKNLVKWTKLSH